MDKIGVFQEKIYLCRAIEGSSGNFETEFMTASKKEALLWVLEDITNREFIEQADTSIQGLIKAMKWENDIYRELKWEIFDLLIEGLSEESEKISIKAVMDSVDTMFEAFKT